jgi:hypothetical protein
MLSTFVHGGPSTDEMLSEYIGKESDRKDRLRYFATMTLMDYLYVHENLLLSVSKDRQDNNFKSYEELMKIRESVKLK